ncbi:MAG: hypothetical protein DME82_12595 [Verrucomicrobia bacterium]|nr:MAG: hypothetical protein DME82_12595 [Verrucomicrobiota bacterium]
MECENRERWMRLCRRQKFNQDWDEAPILETPKSRTCGLPEPATQNNLAIRIDARESPVA